jgi:pyruvate-formate lyase-activating enzyme
MRIFIRFRCAWCRNWHTHEMTVTGSNDVTVNADDHRTCPPCHAKVYKNAPAPLPGPPERQPSSAELYAEAP